MAEAGDEVREYVQARWCALVRSAVLLGCTFPEAEDLVQTALARCVASWDSVRRAENPDAYVYRVLLNCFLKSRQRRWHREIPTDQQHDSCQNDASDRVDVRVVLVEAMARLTPEQREALVLRYVADLTVPEIATVLRVREGTVKSRISRAVQAMNTEELREATR
jgi:RNA polymerase sigma-70 factor (sigma-E family)